MTAHKDMVREAIYARRDQIVALAHDLHDRPELAFCEEYAAARLAELLESEGFTIRRSVCGMPTAFVATTGRGPLHVAFCAEYDALPPACLYDRSKPLEMAEVWLDDARHDAPLAHACGHNLIAGASVAAALGLRDIADQVGLTVSVIGTPGEELVGLPEPPDDRLVPGKGVLLDGGVFVGVHAALMVHPGPTPLSYFQRTRAYPRLRACYSPTPARSLGAAELRQLAQALKQAILSAGQAPMLFVARPERDGAGARVDMAWIASCADEAAPARDAVRRCLVDAASASGATVQISEYAVDAPLRNDPLLIAAYRKNSRALGRVRGRDKAVRAGLRQLFDSPQVPPPVRLLGRILPAPLAWSGLYVDRLPGVDFIYGTDLGNVSQVIPAIHPFIGIGGGDANHSLEFAANTETEGARRAMLDGGVALAWTALDAATDPALRAHLLASVSSPTAGTR